MLGIQIIGKSVWQPGHRGRHAAEQWDAGDGWRRFRKRGTLGSVSIARLPRPRLQPFVSLLWADDGSPTMDGSRGRELVLPTGTAHLVVRLRGGPVRVFSGPDDVVGQSIGRCVVGGARAAAYGKVVSNAGASVGAVFQPGAASLLLGAAADELAHRHTNMEAIWTPTHVAELCERLEEATDAPERLLVWEAFLERRISSSRGINPVVAHMLSSLDGGATVSEVVADVGFSHRHLVAAFAQAVGLTPKLYQRLRRFNRALDRLHADPGTSLADLAARLDYADQAHLTREFREFAGLSPGDYRHAAPINARHVPVSG